MYEVDFYKKHGVAEIDATSFEINNDFVLFYRKVERGRYLDPKQKLVGAYNCKEIKEFRKKSE